MQVTRTNKSPTSTSLLIRADASDLTPIKNHVLGHFAGKIKVPGFRVGTAPAALVEKQVDQQALADEFIEHALNQLFTRAIDQEKLRTASKPQVSIKKFVPFTDLEFEVDVEIIGSVKLPDYKRIKLAKKSAEVTTAEINSVIKSLQQRMASRKEVDRPAKKGDEALIDFKGKDKDGKAVEGAQGQDYPLLLGSANFIPGFEEELFGLKGGDKKDFTITFPNDYSVGTLRGKPVTFNVEVKKVSEVVEPKVDDTFAAKAGPVKTVAELKADIKKQLQAEKQNTVERQYENELVKKIVDKSEVEVPPGLVDEQTAQAEENEKRDLLARGQTWQEHLTSEGITEQQHRERQRPDSQFRVKASLVLSEVAEKEDITITPEELEIRIQILKGQYQDPQMQAELDKPENQRGIASQLMTEKTVAKLVEYALKS
ncbi:MAG: trigger factor [bacterium]|nr:trigger factor [bacterium]